MSADCSDVALGQPRLHLPRRHGQAALEVLHGGQRQEGQGEGSEAARGEGQTRGQEETGEAAEADRIGSDRATSTMPPTRKPAEVPPSNLDPDDARILAEALADVTPLSEESRQRVVMRSAPQRAAIGLPGKEPSDHDSNVRNDWTSGYAAPGVRREQVRQLKRGEIPVERVLDLHGCTVEEALVRLRQFIAGCRSAGVRCIRVVHGKGTHSPSGAGVLRDRVWEHLTRRKDVLIVEFAPLRDGGQGAACVLLRK